MDNPWAVGHLEEFLYYCCPECNLSNESIYQSKTLFIQHALEHHPKSKDCMPRLMIKEEPIEGDVHNNSYDFVETEMGEEIYDSENKRKPKLETKKEVTEDVKSELNDSGKEYNNIISKENVKNVRKVINKKHLCDFCDKTFSQLAAFKKHVIKLHEELMLANETNDFNKYMCGFCGKAFQTKKYLQFHSDMCQKDNIKSLDTKSEKTKLIHKCEHCNKEFKFKAAMKIHVGAVHEGQKNHKCDNCGKSFFSIQFLKRHVAVVHEGRKDKKCDLCSKTFGYRTSLKKHMKTVHDGTRDRICNFCGKAYKDLGTLKNHIKVVHEGIKLTKEVDCHLCGKTLSSSIILKEHIARLAQITFKQ